MTQKIPARFITIEGIEGAGKSTAIQSIKNFLLENNIEFIATREPGGTLLAEKIRELLLHSKKEQIATDVELLLMFASRAQHIEELIKPALQQGKYVISDRFSDASYAYQGGGRGIAESRIEQLENWVQGELRPDLTLLLDLPVELGLARMQSRQDTPDRIEQEQKDFFERVRQAYLLRAQQYPERFCIIDATQDTESVELQIKQALQKFL